MTQLEILGELKNLSLEERLELIEQVVQLIRQDIKQIKEQSVTPAKHLPFKSSAYQTKIVSDDIVFRREDIYSDDNS